MLNVVPLHSLASPAAELSDRAILAACTTGDAAAFACLYDRFAVEVHRFLSRLLSHDNTAAEDVLQETFLAAYSACKNYRGEAQPRTWLYSIAANLAAKHRRSWIRRIRREDKYARPSAHRPQNSPHGALESHESRIALRRAINNLPHKLKVAYIMCDVEEVRGVDAAKALGLRDGTLYRRLHEARQRLQEAMQCYWRGQ